MMRPKVALFSYWMLKQRSGLSMVKMMAMTITMMTRPSEMEVSPETFGLSKSIHFH